MKELSCESICSSFFPIIWWEKIKSNQKISLFWSLSPHTLLSHLPIEPFSKVSPMFAFSKASTNFLDPLPSPSCLVCKVLQEGTSLWFMGSRLPFFSLYAFVCYICQLRITFLMKRTVIQKNFCYNLLVCLVLQDCVVCVAVLKYSYTFQPIWFFCTLSLFSVHQGLIRVCSKPIVIPKVSFVLYGFKYIHSWSLILVMYFRLYCLLFWQLAAPPNLFCFL